MPYLKKRTPAKKKRIKDPSWRQPTSPSRRKEPWCSIIVRRETYAMLRELSEHNAVSIGEVIRVLAEQEFHKTLWKVQQDRLVEQRGEVHDRA
jgi:hypothetical protein